MTQETGKPAVMPLDELPGRSVLDSTGRVIGDVHMAVVDLESWAVASLQVRLRRDAASELGLPSSVWKPALLDVPTGLILAARDAVILRAHLDELHSLAPQPVAAPAEPSDEPEKTEPLPPESAAPVPPI